VLAGCPGTLDPSLLNGSGGTSGGLSCDPTTAFNNGKCSSSGCHDMNGYAANFSMATTGWETHLVGVNPMGGGTLASACTANGPYLMPGVQPAAGLFMLKIKGGGGLCGLQMPFGMTPLSSTDQDCIQKWANMIVMNAGGGGSNTDAGGGQ
jgi:hypothetical protein